MCLCSLRTLESDFECEPSTEIRHIFLDEIDWREPLGEVVYHLACEHAAIESVVFSYEKGVLVMRSNHETFLFFHDEHTRFPDTALGRRVRLEVSTPSRQNVNAAPCRWPQG